MSTFQPAPPEQQEFNRVRVERVGRKVRKRLAANKAVQKIGVDKVELWAVPHFLDAIECGRLITMIDARATPSQAYDVEYDRGIRTSYTAEIDPEDTFVRALEARLTALLGVDPVFGEGLQGQRYLAGQEFKAHNDWFSPDGVPWSVEWLHGGQRAITAMIFLNDVDEGGETDFPLLDIAITPRAGTLLIWNNADETGRPNRLTLHAGNPVRRGTKYIVTKWYRCQPWHRLGSIVPALRQSASAS
jgi:prolyl 4-hydroxylase